MKGFPTDLWVLFGYGLFFIIILSPAWVNGFWLSPEDNYFDYAPRFHLPGTEWTNLIFGGFPLRADPQHASFYPLRWFFASIGSWNAYVILAYALGSFFTYLFILAQTKSRSAAVISGIAFGASGFMLRMLHMQSTIQAIIWLPLILWGIEKQRTGKSLLALAIGAFAIAMACFGGHPQMFFYSMITSLLYAALSLATTTRSRRDFAWHVLGLFALGLALAAPQWLRTLEYVQHTQRAELNFTHFTLSSWSLLETARLVVPAAFTLLNSSVWQGQSHCPSVNLHEEHTSVALVILMFSVAAMIVYRRQLFAWFWFALALFSFVFALGNNSFLSSIMFHVPGYNLFRVPSRHMIIFVLATAVLAGHFIAYLIQKPREALYPALAGISVISILYGIGVIALFSHDCLPLGGTVFSLSLATLIATIAVVLAFAFLWPRATKRGKTVLTIVLLFVAGADLLQASWFRFGFVPGDFWPQVTAMKADEHELLSLPRPEDFSPPSHVPAIKETVLNNHTRMWASRGKMAGRAGMLNNVSMGWGLPNMAGYSPLAPKTVLDLMEIIYGGTALTDWWRPQNQALDLAAIEYVSVPKADSQTTILNGIPFNLYSLFFSFGFDRPHAVFDLNSRNPIRKIVLVSVLEPQTPPDAKIDKRGTILATLEAYKNKRLVQRWPIRVGHEIADAAAHCFGGIKPSEAQGIPIGPVVKAGNLSCPLLQYFWPIELDTPLDFDRLEISYKAPSPVNFRLVHLSFIDTAGQAVLLSDTLQELNTNPKWEYYLSASNVNIYRNKNARPRAYMVNEIIGDVGYEDQLKAIHYGRLPWGFPFDGKTQALVTGMRETKYAPSCNKEPVNWRQDDLTRIELETMAEKTCFLVLADTHYINWRASINGKPVEIYPTNVAFRGIEAPKGHNVVVFEYEPSFYGKTGDVLGILGFLGGLGIVLLTFLRRWRNL